MGDENSLAGQTRAHKHSSPAGDGGFLETAITGVTNTTTGSLVTFDSSSQATNLNAGSNGDLLEVVAGSPSWVTPSASGTWTELINIYDAGDVDTGFVDMRTYRWLDIWVSANIPVGGGNSAPLLQWYDPNGNIAGGTHYSSAGFFNSTFYQTGSGSDIPLTFDQTITADRPFFFNMKVTCSPVNLPAGGASMFSWTFSHRIAPNASYASGAGICIDGWTPASTALQFMNGFTLSEGNTYDDVLISVYGAGTNTS